MKGERGQVLEGEEKLSGFFIQQEKEHEPLLVFHRFVFCDTVSLTCPRQLKKWINVKIIPANSTARSATEASRESDLYHVFKS